MDWAKCPGGVPIDAVCDCCFADRLSQMSRCLEKRIPGTSYTPKIDCSKVRKSGIMTTRWPDTGMFACPMTQTMHGVCYLSRKPGRYPSESNDILIFYLIRRGLEPTQQSDIRQSDIHTIPQNWKSEESKFREWHSPAQWPNVLLGPL